MERQITAAELNKLADTLEAEAAALDYANAAAQLPKAKDAARALADCSEAAAADLTGEPRRLMRYAALNIDDGMGKLLQGPGYFVHKCGEAVKAARYAAALLTAWDGVEDIHTLAASVTNWADRMAAVMGKGTFDVFNLATRQPVVPGNFQGGYSNDGSFKVRPHDTLRALYDTMWDLRTVTAEGAVRDELDAVIRRVSLGVGLWCNDNGHLLGLATRDLLALARRYAAAIEAWYPVA